MIGDRILAAGLILWLAATAAAAAAEPPVRARSAQALATLFSDEDYPSDAIRNGEQGIVAFRLAVGPDGRPSGCTVTDSSGSESLDSTTCRLLMERPSFEPARDSKGKAVADAVAGRIVWRLPADTMDRPEAAKMLWGFCILGEAAKLAMTELAADEIARRSYPPCAALEAVAARESGQAGPLETERAGIVQGLEQSVLKARTVLKTPVPAGK